MEYTFAAAFYFMTYDCGKETDRRDIMQHNQSASDLFCEQFGAAAPCHGNFAEKFSLFGIDAYRGSISDKSSHSGDYVTVDCGCMWLPSFNTESAVRAVA